MRKVNTFILFIFFVSLFFCPARAQKQVKTVKPKGYNNATVNHRIDNMGYWKKMAEKGLVPVSPQVEIPVAVYTGSMINAKSVFGGKEDSPDVPVTNATNVTESENSVFVDPSDNEFLLNSNNSTDWSGGSVGSLYGANYFLSEDAGLTWGGSAQGAGGPNSGDPTTAINLEGTKMFVNYISNSWGQGIAYSSNNGANWSTATVAPNPGFIADKNHMWIDNCPTSPFEGNVYVAWTDFGGSYDNQVVITRSITEGVNWSSRIQISGSISTFDHGVNVNTGPNGEVYACWATYPSSGLTENGIGFNKSLDGGVTFGTPVKIISNLKGIRELGVNKNMRVNSFPVMAVDISGGTYNGNIYVVWTNIGVPGINTGTSADVYMIKSSDQGVNWSVPIKVNQDAPGLGKKHYFPWITCDPENGILSVIFYDDRNVGTSQCEVWCANSSDGGETWEDFKVSDVSFTPTPIPGLADNYMGDYLGITARGNKVYPVWTDTRNGKFMTYTSPYFTNSLLKPTNLTLQLDEPTGHVDMGWLYEGKDFLYFNVYREGELLGTTTDLIWSDDLPDYGIYQYSVTAMHTEGESVPAVASIQWGNPHIGVAPGEINENLIIGTSTTKVIVVKNIGELELEYSVDPIINNKKSGKDYCEAASSQCDEYISNVTFGDVNNSSDCDYYHDYTDLSAIINVGQSIAITVTNGDLNWPEDQCGIWVDWNQDQDFDDAEETISVSGTPGVGPYTAEIIPPVTALPGETRLRVRITYTGTVEPCGTTTYGEVEDYSVFVTGNWLTIDNYGGNLMPGDSALINAELDASDLESGIYTADIEITSNDPDMGLVTVPVTLAVGESIPVADAYANPALICEGSETQLFVDVTGGTGTFTYNWSSIPEGFTSTDPSPVVNPSDTTIYIVEVFDGIFTVTDEALVEVMVSPGISGTPEGETSLCTGPSNQTLYQTSGAEYALSYSWSLTPETAGTISGAGETGEVNWNDEFTGDALISVKGINDCGLGEASETLMVTIHPLPGIGFELGVDSVCIYTPAFELNTATPAGGVYTGEGVTVDNENKYWFNPADLTTGNYQVVYSYTDEYGCENFSEEIIYVSECLGINEVFGGLQVEIYPNPNFGLFTVKLKSDSSESMNLKILNNLGMVVFEESDFEVSGIFMREIDLKGFSDGLYFVNIFSNNINYIEKIIVKR